MLVRSKQRAMRALLLLAVTTMATSWTVAYASWPSSGSGPAATGAVTVGAGNPATTAGSGRDVTLTWPASSFSNGVTVPTYLVTRYDSTGTVVASMGSGTCASTVTGTSCTETAVPSGSWRYSVTPAVGSWRGTESTMSPVTVAAPSLSLTPVLARATATLSGTAANLVAGESVRFRLDDPASGAVLAGTLDGVATPTAVGASGGGAVTVVLPAGTTAGPHTVYLVASPSGETAAQPITVDNTPPPAPSITSGPASPTASTSATLVFSDTESGVTFRCTLDGAPAATCTSPTTYSGLADAAHTFTVVALDAAGNTSTAATRTWTVDTTAPTNTITFPTTGAVLNAAAYTAGCATTSTGDLCGTTSDTTAVATVRISLQQASTGRYWNGTGFTPTTETLLTPTGTTTWTYTLAGTAIPNGTYTLRAYATDTAGNQSTTTSTFVMDKTAPPAPAISGAPAALSSSSTAGFTFSDTEAGVTFRCTLDAAPASPCTSPAVYRDLTNGAHTFSVTAVDAAGNTSTATTHLWTVSAPAAGGGLTFPVAGAAYGTASWAAGCSTGTGDLCGTASAGRGVAAVTLTIRQVGSGAYWDGSAFASAAPVYLTAGGTTSWSYGLAAAAQPAGTYAVRYWVTDTSGETSAASPTTSYTTDFTAPVASAPSTTNAGTAGRLDLGDAVLFTTNEALAPGSLLAGWTGGTTGVVVRVTNGGTDVLTVWDASGSMPVELGSLDLRRSDFVTATVTFGASGTASTISQTGGVITVRLGTPSAPGSLGTAASTANMRWAPSAAATDLAGNAMPTTLASESDSDKDF